MYLFGAHCLMAFTSPNNLSVLGGIKTTSNKKIKTNLDSPCFSLHVTQTIQSDRLPVQSSELGPPIPSPAGECCSLSLGPREKTHSNSEGTDTLVFCVYYNPSTVRYFL
jgi:hypothetical protein